MRLNVGIAPESLTDEQLFAESRELKMLPSYFERYGMLSFSKAPERFTLGKGHILFFAFKPTYTLTRYKKVLAECRNRNINVKDESFRWGVYGDMCDEFEEEEWMRKILVERICEKIDMSPKKYFHYHHQVISKKDAKNMLKKVRI